MIRTLVIMALCFASITLPAQGPSLSLVGSSASFSKGSINTEVLTAVIQAKQQEVKEKVFRNAIIDEFERSSVTENLRNFTTYYFLYGVMDGLTSGKNKTEITKAVITSSSEFAYVFGLAAYFNYLKQGAVFSQVKPQIGPDGNSIYNNGDFLEFNLLMDICYDVILTDPNKTFEFQKDTTTNRNFAAWYNNYNVYITQYKSANANDRKSLEAARTAVSNAYTQLKSIASDFTTGLKDLNELPPLGNATGQKILDQTLSSFATFKSADLVTKLRSVRTYLVAVDQAKIDDFIANVNVHAADYDAWHQLFNFFIGLEKSGFKDFTISKDQFYSMKYIINEFLLNARGNTENDIVATVIDFLLQNTIVQYVNSSGNAVGESKTGNGDAGFLYVDVESIIQAISAKFSSPDRVRLTRYLVPFLSIGINNAKFIHQNTLTTDANGKAASLSNLYFASEKLGFKWYLFNWKYYNSHSPGQRFDYYGTSHLYNTPMKVSTIADIHVIAYVSGLLYNIANLKSTNGFNYGIVGSGVGVTFFNGLAVNATYGVPFTNDAFKKDNAFFSVGVDIPIIDYLAALTTKN